MAAHSVSENAFWSPKFSCFLFISKALYSALLTVAVGLTLLLLLLGLFHRRKNHRRENNKTSKTFINVEKWDVLKRDKNVLHLPNVNKITQGFNAQLSIHPPNRNSLCCGKLRSRGTRKVPAGMRTVLSVLWSRWLGYRKDIRPVKIWVVGFWCGYLSGARCRLSYIIRRHYDANHYTAPPTLLRSI